MKTSFFSLILATIGTTPSFAQCTVNFANFGADVNAPVTDFQRPLKLNGPGFVAGLFYAPGIVMDSTQLIGPYKTATFTTNGYFFGGQRCYMESSLELPSLLRCASGMGQSLVPGRRHRGQKLDGPERRHCSR
jgi:hypothetical protein